MNRGFQKMLILPIMENSSGRQPKICEVALTNRIVRGQVSSVLMAFISVTSSLKMAAGILATTSVFQLQPYVYIPRAKEKKRNGPKILPEDYFVRTLLMFRI